MLLLLTDVPAHCAEREASWCIAFANAANHPARIVSLVSASSTPEKFIVDEEYYVHYCIC
jgi:hypothetical protein